MMRKVVVFGYATGVISSRKIERELHEDVACRMLGAGNFPKHRTIRDFRALHLKERSDLFVQVVRQAREMGLVKLGTVAIDGTKLKANASRHKAMSDECMQQAEVELKAQIDALLERAKSTAAAEADEPNLDIPAEIARRATRLKAISEARERLEQRQRDADIERGRGRDDDRKPHDRNATVGRFKRAFGVPDPKAQDNFTDPHSRIVSYAGGGFDANDNGQTAVDDTAHIIVAAELGNNASNLGELVPMIEAVAANLDQVPEQVLADAGYRSEAVSEQSAGSGIDAVIALGRKAKRCAEIDPESHPRTAAMDAKLQTDEGKAAYRRRKWLAEPPNGWIKSVHGSRQFSVRGLHRVQVEWKLVCLALNLRRMGTIRAA